MPWQHKWYRASRQRGQGSGPERHAMSAMSRAGAGRPGPQQLVVNQPGRPQSAALCYKARCRVPTPEIRPNRSASLSSVLDHVRQQVVRVQLVPLGGGRRLVVEQHRDARQQLRHPQHTGQSAQRRSYWRIMLRSNSSKLPGWDRHARQQLPRPCTAPVRHVSETGQSASGRVAGGEAAHKTCQHS